MWPRSSRAVPAMTAQVARTAFPNGCLAIRIRDALGEVFEDAQFAELFATRGRPAVSPARLALVSVLQFAEGCRTGRLLTRSAPGSTGSTPWAWNSLTPALTPRCSASSAPGCSATTRPSGCWARCLIASGSEGCWCGAGGSAPMPPTCWPRCASWAAWSWSSRRCELRWTRWPPQHRAGRVALVPADWFARYGQRASDWRLPKAEAARAALAASVGVDGFALLEAVYADQAPAWLRQVPAVQTLRMTWLQRYYRDGQGCAGVARQSSRPARWPSAACTTPGPLRVQTRDGLARRQGPLHRDLRA
jgi:hypothetical protein